MTHEEVVKKLNTNSYFVDKVAAGLRRMNTKPVAFLFFDKEYMFYDKVAILGIPVYRTTFIYQGNGQEELSFYPIFSDAHFDSTIEVSNFRKGYEEY